MWALGWRVIVAGRVSEWDSANRAPANTLLRLLLLSWPTRPHPALDFRPPDFELSSPPCFYSAKKAQDPLIIPPAEPNLVALSLHTSAEGEAVYGVSTHCDITHKSFKLYIIPAVMNLYSPWTLWDSSRCSGFLLHSKDMQFMLLVASKLLVVCD